MIRAAESESRSELESVEVDVLSEVGVGAGVGKILLTRPGVAGYQPSTKNDFGQTVIGISSRIH